MIRRAAPIPPCQKNTEAACERESHEGNTARPDEKRIQIQYTRCIDKMQHLSEKSAKKFCREEKINGLALSVTCGDSSPKGRALGKTGNFAVLPKPLTLGEVALRKQ